MISMLRNRRVLLSITLAALGLAVWYTHRAPGDREMPGSYAVDGEGSSPQIVLRSDGTFSDYSEHRDKSGNWQLIDREYIFGPELELKGGEGTSSYADSYLLARKAGRVCIEPTGDDGEEFAYWCNTHQ
jgi:hypothetical protein